MIAHLFEEQYQRLQARDLLEKLRHLGWKRYCELGFPEGKSERFRYLKVAQLFAGEYELARKTEVEKAAVASSILPLCQQSHLAFVNGCWEERLSSLGGVRDQLVVESLDSAMQSYGTYLNNQWSRLFASEKDPFVAINAALHSGGTFFYLPPNCTLGAPIQLLEVTAPDERPTLAMPRLHFFVGKGARLQLIITQKALSDGVFWNNSAVELVLEEGAQATLLFDSEGIPFEGRHFESLRAQLKRDSRLDVFFLSRGSRAVRSDCQVSLAGENSEVNLSGLWHLDGRAEAHATLSVEHLAPNCRSSQLFKGVLRGRSRSAFSGRIYVDQEAQKTAAYQRNSTLLLSPDARANSKPQLEIFADDVKASHGATVGQLDQEELHYLRTRGIGESEAKELLIEGFCQEVRELIPQGWR